MDAADDLDAAFAAIEEYVEIPGGGAEVFQQGRRVRVEGGEDEALVDVELGHGNEAPLGLVQLVVVGVLQVGDGLQRAVVAEGPAVIGADEGGGVAVVGAAEAVAAVAADVQERADLAGAVAHHQHRVFAHVGGEEVAGVGNLRLVAEQEPAAGENLLQLLLVDFLVAEYAGVDDAVVGVHQGSHLHRCHGGTSLPAWLLSEL